MPKPDYKRWQLNRLHWTENLDAQNLAGSSQEADLELLLALFETEDVRRALSFLEPLRGRRIIDLGGGLGLMAILIARRGGTVIIADLSLPRLRKARELARRAGAGDLVRCVQCTGENLPFLCESLDGEITKSVLIHTDLPQTAAELARILSPRGKAVFIEPLNRNPLVNFYRRFAAPRVWKQITEYYSSKSIRQTLRPFRLQGRRVRVERLYLLGFIAGVFNYFIKAPGVYRVLEKAFLTIDGILFRTAPALRERAWFCLIKIE